MTQSIRTYLIINLLLSVTFILSLAIIGNLTLEHRNMEKRIDTQLAHTAFRLESFALFIGHNQSIEKIQAKINEIPIRTKDIIPFENNDLEVQKIINTQFQIWQGNRLLLKSRDCPPAKINGKLNTFTTQTIQGAKWRTLTTKIPEQNITTAVYENIDLQKRLEGHITQSSALIILMTYPFLALLIWFIVGRGLNSIRIATREIKHRAPHFLKPLSHHNVPIEIKPFIDELNKLLKKLQLTLEREKRFASDAAHELRTPLAVIRTQTQLAFNTKKKAEKDLALQKVMESVDRSAHIIQQLLTLCRLEPEANLEQKVAVDLVEQAREVITELFPSAIEKHTDVELHHEQEQVIVIGHSAGIFMLLRNLIDNAIKYSPEHSLVQVYIETNAEQCPLIRVVDNGKGIPGNLHERSFERFFRGLGEKSPGCGLGLGIVQQVIQAHHADIHLTTPASGQGLEVIVEFPHQSRP